MTDISVIENRISAVKKYLNTLERYKKYSVKELEHDIDIRGAVERYLYLTVQSTIDLADALIAHKSYRKPVVQRDAFYILQEEGVVPIELMEKLVKMVGFRNTIAHDYQELNYDIVYHVLHNDLKDIEPFLNFIVKAV